MKKILSLALIMCMLASLCVSFASCNKVSEGNVNKKPAEVLSEAMSNTFSDFFEEDLGIAKVFEKAKDKSAVNVYFESDDLMGGDITRIGATIYSDVKNSEYALEAEAKYKGDTLTATAFANKKSFAVAGESLFGNDEAYELNFKSFVKKFEDSDLPDLLGVSGNDIDELVEFIDKLEEDLSTSAKKNKDKYDKMMNEVFELLEQEATTEEIENLDGKDIKCVVVTYSIDNKTLKKAVSHIVETLAGEIEMAEDIEETVDMLFEELDNGVTVNIDCSLYLNKKTNKVEKVALDGQVIFTHYDDYSGAQTSEKINLAAELNISNEKIELEAEVGANAEEKYKISVEIEKEVDDKDVTYSLAANVGQGSAMMNVLNAKVELLEKGDFNISADVMVDDDGERYAIELGGKVEVTSNSVLFEFNSLKFGDTTVKFKLGIGISSKVSMPKMPSKANDIVDLTEDDWEDLGKDIMKSDIGKLFSGM